jgi:hypothetical protein
MSLSAAEEGFEFLSAFWPELLQASGEFSAITDASQMGGAVAGGGDVVGAAGEVVGAGGGAATKMSSFGIPAMFKSMTSGDNIFKSFHDMSSALKAGGSAGVGMASAGSSKSDLAVDLGLATNLAVMTGKLLWYAKE